MLRSRVAFFVDFDHTLFDTDKFFNVDARKAFLELGVDETVWDKTYGEVRNSGYTLEKHTEAISRQCGVVVPLTAMKAVLAGRFVDLRGYLFPDAVPFLWRARNNGAMLFLLSFGDKEWQEYKVKGSGILEFFDQALFTTKGGKKAEIVAALAAHFNRVVVVDNDPKELDLVKEHLPSVETWRVNRVPDWYMNPPDDAARLRFLSARRYAVSPSRFNHRECRGICGLDKIFGGVGI